MGMQRGHAGSPCRGGFPSARFSLSHCKVLPYVMASPYGPLKDQILQKVENPVKSALA